MKLHTGIHGLLSSWPIRARLAAVVFLGVAAMAAALSILMLSTARDSFNSQSEAQLAAENGTVASEINNLDDRAAGELLLARHNQSFDRYFLAEDGSPQQQQALADIHETISYVSSVFDVGEICLIDVAAPSVRASSRAFWQAATTCLPTSPTTHSSSPPWRSATDRCIARPSRISLLISIRG
jgi:hypothetical protein